MTNECTRRDVLRTGVAGLGVLAIPEWALPALAPGEEIVPFTDIPESFATNRGPDRRFLDLREIDGPFTPRDRFFTTQHHGHPTVDPQAYRLKVTGLVERPKALTLDDIRGMGNTVLDAGFECSGNSARSLQGLVSNGRWTGVALRDVLKEAGVMENAREVVFFGAVQAGASVPFRVTLDGQPVGESAGTDVDADGRGVVTEQNTYQLVRQSGRVGDRVFEIEFDAAGVEAYCFTFG